MSSRRVVAILLTGAALAACGADSPRTTEAPVTEPVTTESAVPATVPAPESAATEVGALVPEVLCVREAFDGLVEVDVFFAVDNQTGTPVAVADSTANVLTGVGSPDEFVDNPRVPTVFGIGRTSPAFVAVGNSDSVSWSLTGPDGVTRTATATVDSPVCNDDVLQSSIGDDRDFSLEFAIVSADGTPPTDVRLLIAPTDPSTIMSRCGAGLEALPAQTRYLVNGELRPVGGPLELQMAPPAEWNLTEAISVASADVEYAVIDRCAFGGVESLQWPVGPNYVDFGYSDATPNVCVSFDGTKLRLDDFEPCPGLPLTGGSRVRPS